MAVRANNRSALMHAFAVTFKDVRFYSRMEVPEIKPAQDDVLHVVKDHDRLDNLASIYYGTPFLTWVLARANGIWLEPNELVPGVELRIPTIDRLRAEGVLPR